jgi:hypothetical protein
MKLEAMLQGIIREVVQQELRGWVAVHAPLSVDAVASCAPDPPMGGQRDRGSTDGNGRTEPTLLRTMRDHVGQRPPGPPQNEARS